MKKIERRLERMVEGTFARLFRTGVGPIEVARRLTREMDHNRNVGVGGVAVVPNHFTISLSSTDHGQFIEVQTTLAESLVDAAKEHASDEGYDFLGPVEVEFELDEALATGSFEIASRLREGPPIVVTGALTLPTGEEVILRDDVVVVGRMSDCEVVIADPNISRHHAEIHPDDDDGWVLIDKGSTNGSLVNGHRVERHRLVSGDVLSFGTVRITFAERT